MDGGPAPDRRGHRAPRRRLEVEPSRGRSATSAADRRDDEGADPRARGAAPASGSTRAGPPAEDEASQHGRVRGLPVPRGLTVPDVFMLEMMSGISSALPHERLRHARRPGRPDRHLVGGANTSRAGRVDGFVLLVGDLHAGAHPDAPRPQGAVHPLGHLRPETTATARSAATASRAGGSRPSTSSPPGRRRVAFLGGPAAEAEVQDRYRGLRDGSARRRSRGRSRARRLRGTGRRTSAGLQRSAARSRARPTSTPSSRTAT